MKIFIRRPDQNPFPVPPPEPRQPAPEPAIPHNWYGPVSPTGYPLVTADPVEQDRYEAMRAQGQSHSMAEVLVCKSFPGVVTDATFMRGRHNGASLTDVHPENRNHYLEVARKAGVSTNGKAYMPSLAKFPGDPMAWVDSRADVERIAHQNGFTVESPTINVPTPRYFDPGPEVTLAPDIVDRELARMALSDPGVMRDPNGARQDIIERHRGYHNENYQLSQGDYAQARVTPGQLEAAISEWGYNSGGSSDISDDRVSLPAGLANLPLNDPPVERPINPIPGG